MRQSYQVSAIYAKSINGIPQRDGHRMFDLKTPTKLDGLALYLDPAGSGSPL